MSYFKRICKPLAVTARRRLRRENILINIVKMRYNYNAMRMFLAIAFLVCVRGMHALDVEITEKEAQAHLRGEYNRNYDFSGDIQAIGAVELNDRLKFRTGLSIGWAQDITDLKIFSGARYRLFAKWPLALGLSWLYNGLPEYDAHSHTLLPGLSWNERYWGAAIGPGFRFTSFFKEPAVYEPTLSIGVYANFVNNEKFRVGISLANFNDFQANNFTFYSLCLNSAVRINPCWSLLNELEFKQSGGDGLAAAFYGIAMRAGAGFKW